MIGEGNSGLALSHQSNVDLVAGEGESFLVSPVFDVNDRPGPAVVGNGVKSVLDLCKVPRSILGDNDVVTGIGLRQHPMRIQG